MPNIVKNYIKDLEVVSSFHIVSSLQNQVGRKSKMSDIEVVVLSLSTEFISIDSENHLFKLIDGAQISDLIEGSQFNKRRKKLFSFTVYVSSCLYSRFTDYEDYFIIDSMPLEIFKKARQNRLKICKEDFHTAPDKGYQIQNFLW